MKHYKIWILLAVLVLLLVACSGKAGYDLTRPEEDIVKISIVQMSYEYSGEKMVREVLYEIEDIEEINVFLVRFKNIKCVSKFDYTALHVSGESVAIKFDYRDGFYELVDWRAQFQYDPIRKGLYIASPLTGHFDKEQFEKFLSWYLK